MDDISKSISHKDNVMRYKLIILYFLKRMELPVTTQQITEFVRDEGYMEYFVMDECLNELIDVKYVSYVWNEDTNTSSITLLKDGLDALECLSNQIAPRIKQEIDRYIIVNKGRLRREHEITANYFYDAELKEYLVKCGLFEVDKLLMEISVSVVSKDTARLVCKNWTNTVNTLYGEVFTKLISTENTNKKEV